MPSSPVVVAISGGFDPLHVGHARYIAAARRLGDTLVVILNGDEFLMRKKGAVFMPQAERREMLLALKGVDEVVDSIDTDQTVCRTLELVRPDIFAKGGDRIVANTPEVETCRQCGIEMVFGVGGGKVQSSSWLTDGYRH